MSETEGKEEIQKKLLLDEVRKVTEANKELVNLLKLLESLGDVERPKPTYTSHYVNMKAYSQ